MNDPAHPPTDEWPRHCVTLFESAFREWNRAGIEFVVLRNYERLPLFAPGDVDVLVAEGQRARAEELLCAAAGAAGYRLHNRAEYVPVSLYFHHLPSRHQVHVDLSTSLRWRGFDLLGADRVLAGRVEHGLFFIPQPIHEAVVTLLTGLLFNGRVKEKYRSGISRAFQAQPDPATPILSEALGEQEATRLAGLVRREDWPAVEDRARRLRRALAWRQVRCRPCHTARVLASDTLRLLRRFIHPPGLVVVICGPDGIGKSTVTNAALSLLSVTFSPQKGLHIHWKPRVLSAGRSDDPTTNPHGQRPRNPVASLLYFAFHWLEFLLGSWVRIRPATFRGGLVIAERFFYDFLVDQRRYRLRLPRWIVAWGCAWLPQPDLVLLLDAPAEVVQRRKREVPPQETARQRNAYLGLVKGLRNGGVIDALQPPEKVATDIQAVVLDLLTVRAAKRNAGHPAAATPGPVPAN
jgi:thymidylate kinase